MMFRACYMYAQGLCRPPMLRGTVPNPSIECCGRLLVWLLPAEGGFYEAGCDACGSHFSWLPWALKETGLETICFPAPRRRRLRRPREA